MNRRELLRTAALGATSTTLSAARRPNILILFSDDQRYDTLSGLGHPEVKTPNLDRLMKRGTAFDHAFIMGGTIGAICVPSRAMLLTGQSLFHVHDSIIAPDKAPSARQRPFEMFPETFHRAGYTTFGTGKWHNGPKLYARAFERGGPIMFGGMSDHDKVPVMDYDPAGEYPKAKVRTGEKFSSELFSDAAVRFLREYKEDKPFLMYVAYTAPHDPRTPPQDYVAMYPAEHTKLPPNFLPQHPFDNGEMKVRDEMLAPWPRTPETIRRHIAEYYGMITHMDAQIGRVLAALQESGKADNTIVVFAGDNGLAVGQHGLLGKQNLYDHSIRVPLILAGPGVPRGKRTSAMCYLLDLFPTLCDLTGVEAPATVEGRSLAPVLRGRSETARDSIFAAYRDVQRTVRTERWKLILYQVSGRRTVQLFDIRNDPWEMKNLAQDPQHAGRLEEMRGLLRDWMKRVDDPLQIEV
jgi:arylsulfatase A-like enzyme